MLQGHAEYENSKLHALLKKKGSAIFREVEKEHEHQDAHLVALEGMLEEILSAKDKSSLIELGYQFYLSYRKFVGENLLHLHHEETEILPELQRLYSDEELREVEFATYRIMNAEEMVQMMEVLFPHMNVSDKEALLKDIKDSEPQKFREAWESINNSLDSDERNILLSHL